MVQTIKGTSCKWKSLKKAALGCRIPSRTSLSSWAHFCSISAIVCSCLIRPFSRLNTSLITPHRYLYSSPSASLTWRSSSPWTALVSPKWMMTHCSITSSMASGWRACRRLGRRVGAGTPEWKTQHVKWAFWFLSRVKMICLNVRGAW